MILKYFFILNLLFSFNNAFILPQIFREWHPIGIENTIDKSKPYIYNIGKLPMILWYDNKKPISTINICKHLGAKLNNGIINDGCLHCPNHYISYNETDTIGKVVAKNGLLWWSYKSYSKNPPSIFKLESDKIHHLFMDIDINIINVILEFIYSNNKTKVKYRKNKFIFNEQLFNAEHRFFYKYPYFLKGSINKKINYTINFSPLDDNKTRLYISIANNFDAKIFINYYLNAKLNNLKNYDSNYYYLKYLIMLKEDRNYMKDIYLLFDKYSFPNDFTVASFYKYRQFY